MPSWGWWTLGLAVLGALTFVAYAYLIGVDSAEADRDREWRTRQRLYGANGLRPVPRRRLHEHARGERP